MSSDQQPLPPPPGAATNTLSLMNLTLLDPPRWGWTAVGGVADVLPSHERARRKRARTSYFAERRQRERDPMRNQQFLNVSATNLSAKLETVHGSLDTIDAGEINAENHDLAQTETSETDGGVDAAAVKADGGNNEPKLHSVSALPIVDNVMQDASQLSGDIDFEETETQQHGTVLSANKMSEWSERSDKSNATLKNGTIRPSALQDDGVLDMFTYHRGREGQEPRDNKSGELLCDVEPTDTNYGVTEPRLKINVTIEFPLQDAEEMGKESSTQSSHETQAFYRDNVEWDLSNVSTVSPMEYALKVADEFGLSFGQTVDLAVSIQNQIDDFLRGHITYSAPITIRDPSGLEREPRKPGAFSLQLYGSVSGQARYSGFPLSRKQRVVSRSVYSSKPIGNKPKPIPEDELGVEVVKTMPSRSGCLDSSAIEEEYIVEAKSIAKAKSVEHIRQKQAEAGSKPVAILNIIETGNCHICHKRYSNVAQFPCLFPTHVFCAHHCKAKLGISIPEGCGPSPLVMECCPICSFQCSCISCIRRVRAAAAELKANREGQGTDDAPLDNGDVRTSLRTRSVVNEARRSSKGNKPALRQGRGDKIASCVPKVPASDFPREVCGGLDLDPGTPADYLTVHTFAGSFLQPGMGEECRAPLELSSESSVQEDGNVDYCQQCRMPGSLLCCDFCPRAYHPKCLVPDIQVPTPWECPVCVEEKGGLADDNITGQTSAPKFRTTFAHYEEQTGVQILSIIHEMLNKLIDYDFGETFKEPVDLSIIGYKEMIKNPMDLGTIKENLVNGTYQKRASASGSLDDIILDVLKDVELVWHNCFTFNREGSAIYRMAEVLRRRSLKIRQVSFEHLLPEKVKEGLANYVLTCEEERRATARPAEVTKLAHFPSRGNARYKITVKWQKGGLSRAVAILDPDSGLVVKIYSTMRAAGIAAAFLSHNLGHPCELKSLTDISVKGVIHHSAADSSLRLFGYRWLSLDELRGRKVHFSQPEKKRIVEIIDECGTHMFQSIEDALSYARLPRDVPLNYLRDHLQQLTPGPEYMPLMGMSFRVLLAEKPPPETDVRATPSHTESISSGCRPPTSLISDQESLQVSENVVVLKEDIVARRKLAGFESVHVACLDWLRTFDSSPSVLDNVARTEAHFREHYLDGDRNIDGIRWRSSKSSYPDIIESFDSHPTPTAFHVNGSHGIERGDVDVASDPVIPSSAYSNAGFQDDKTVNPSDAEPPIIDRVEAKEIENSKATGDERPQMNGFLHENQSSLHFLAQVTELEESFPSSPSRVENLGFLPTATQGKLRTDEDYASELLQAHQTAQNAHPNDGSDVQTIIKTFRQ